jgi:thiamine biosynthesis lipoprotein
MEAELRFPAMGSEAHVIVLGGSLALLDLARDTVEELEGRWSRFRASSEVSRMNEAAGRPVRVAPGTLTLVERAVEGARRTEGRFDPTVLGAMIRAGYDRSFELVGEVSTERRSDLAVGVDRIRIDRVSSTVTLPSGVGFDPGGIGKGLAADLVVNVLRSRGALGACVNLGGDLRVMGASPQAGGWVIEIAHPTRSDPAATVVLRAGAVATSTRTKRAWGPPGDRRHHLIDPSTGEPAGDGPLAATAVAAEGWQAEVAAKAAVLGGPGSGLRAFDALGVDGLVVDADGGVHRSDGFGRFLARPRRRPAGVAR